MSDEGPFILLFILHDLKKKERSIFQGRILDPLILSDSQTSADRVTSYCIVGDDNCVLCALCEGLSFELRALSFDF